MKRQPPFIVFAILLALAMGLLLLERLQVLGPIKRPFENILIPIEGSANSISTFFSNKWFFITTIPEKDTKLKKLESERQALFEQLGELAKLKEENTSLREQLGTSPVTNTRELLEAHIIGRPTLLIVDKGKADGVLVGDVVVSKNIVIGRVSDVSERLSKVLPVTNTRSTIGAKTVRTGATGVVKGSLGNIILDNVTLDTTLETNDMVVTSGDVNENGIGYPPGLVIGKIVSIDKSESNLFQRAKLESPLRLESITVVFLISLKR